MDALVQALKSTLSQNPSDHEEALTFLRQASESNYAVYLYQLSTILCTTNNPTSTYVRQAAGLQLKNALVPKMQQNISFYHGRWLSLSDEMRDYVKASMLRTLGTERRPSTAAQCIAAIAGIELPSNQWMDLINTLSTNVTNPVSNETLREASLETLGYICQDMPSSVMERSINFNQIITAIVHGMRNEETSVHVRLAAINAFLCSLEFARGNFENGKERDVIMQVICNNTQSLNIDVRVGAFRCLVKMFESIHFDHLEPYIEVLFEISVQAMNYPNDAVVIQGIDLWSNIGLDAVITEEENKHTFTYAPMMANDDDGGWTEENCNTALNYLVAGKLAVASPSSYTIERQENGSICCTRKIILSVDSVIRGLGYAKHRKGARKAWRFDIVQQLFHRGLLPSFDGNHENLIKWINERYRKCNPYSHLSEPTNEYGRYIPADCYFMLKYYLKLKGIPPPKYDIKELVSGYFVAEAEFISPEFEKPMRGRGYGISEEKAWKNCTVALLNILLEHGVVLPERLRDTIMAYIRQRIHELQRTEQNRHKLEALRSISSSVCEFIHCWMEDDDDERTNLAVKADDLRTELNGWFLRQTNPKCTYLSIIALVVDISTGFIAQHRPQIRPAELELKLIGNGTAKLKRHKENAAEQTKICPPLKRTKCEFVN